MKYSLKQLFIEYLMNWQLSATCFGFLELSSGWTWEDVCVYGWGRERGGGYSPIFMMVSKIIWGKSVFVI
jgi:hypothetical protein